jgi:stearoyl-CoA desaturase (delta-9 desaturase)
MRGKQALRTIVRWFDSGTASVPDDERADRVDWLRLMPFIGLHLLCFGVIWVGFSWAALAVAVGLYLVRMFAITGFYHRYFSHRTFETSRVGQFLFAVLGNASGQRGPLWWAAHHRKHHRVSDTDEDVHSPHTHGILWSHCGWFTTRRNFVTDLEAVPDLARYPELRLLDRFDVLAPLTLAAVLYLAGGWQFVIWGFGISTVAVFHATCSINSLAHLMGRRRYPTGDQSRNSFLLALLTLGEGWHNNHHYYPGAVRQGFRWWEIDLTYYGLVVLSWLGIVRNLHPVPARVREAAS